MASKDWAHKMLDEITPGWYGEITFTIRSGEIRAVAKTQTFIAPDIQVQHSNPIQKKGLTQFNYQEHSSKEE